MTATYTPIRAGKKLEGCYPLRGPNDMWIGDIPDRSIAKDIAHRVNCHDDLLAALKNAVSILEDAIDDDGTRQTEIAEIKAMRAAIAKAEGP